MDITLQQRGSHPSREQIDVLLEYLEKNTNLVKGFPRLGSAREVSKIQWENLALRLNALNGCCKSCKQWIKYWSDKKSFVKKKVAMVQKYKLSGGVGVAEVELSEVDEKILKLMEAEGILTEGTPRQLQPNEPQLANDTTLKQTLAETSYAIKPSYLVSAVSWPITNHEPTVSANRRLESPSPEGAHPSPTPSVIGSRRRLRRKRDTVLLRGPQVKLLAERLIKVEELRTDLERRKTETFERMVTMVDRLLESERDYRTATTQALLSIGEGLKMIAEVLTMDKK
ncbi:hypothetical protein evm_003630 [Chilo suppressalis]|nr:hypothetical protein evm_003630 [Chilo suppressalis]